MKKAPKEPSAESLREMPETDFSKGVRNPYLARIQATGFRVGPGRPRKGEASVETVVKSVRLPRPVLLKVERRAKALGIPLHAALRQAVAEWASQR